MTQSKIVVMGSGKIGHLVSQLLANTSDYHVTAVDANIEVAQKVTLDKDGKPLANAAAESADFKNKDDLKRVLSGKDYVLSCAPYHCNKLIAEVAKECGVNYLDLTEDVETTHYIRDLSKDSELAFIPQCGLAPGFIGIVANHLYSQFQEVEKIKMRVGALPQYPHNRLKYNLTWSTEGLINEYGNPCEAVVDNKLTLLQPLEGLETFTLDGVEYEAFNTSGGLGTLAETLESKVKNLNYKSIRYPGHRDIIALLMDDLKLNEDRDTLKKIFENSMPRTFQDVVIIFVTATGWNNGRYEQSSYAEKIYASDLFGQTWGAIQVTTAAGLCAVLDLHREGKLQKNGFISQEDVPFKDFIANRFGKFYNTDR